MSEDFEHNKEQLKEFINSTSHAADISEFLGEVNFSEWPKLLRLIDDSEKRAEVFAELDKGKWGDLLELLKPDEISSLIKELESDDAADIIAKLALPLRYEILYRLPQSERQQVLELLGYPEDSAGGIMQVELVRVRDDASIAEAVNKVRELVEEDVQVLAVWVVDKEDKLIGSIELADLIVHKATKHISSLIEHDIISVRPLVSQTEVAQLFKKYDLLTLPVVDDENHLIGRISVDDVVDVISEEAEEDAIRMGGTSIEELIHPEKVFSTTRIRLPWLAVALICSLVSASLITFFEPLLKQITLIYAFMPVIMAMGGNVGTQSSTILIRGLATGKIDLEDIPKILFKEIRVGLLMGLFYGVCAGLVATFVLSDQNTTLGLIVLFSMIITMMTAAMLGVIAPAILKRFNIDPAIAAGPFVTTFNDITGILIYMTIAKLLGSYFGMF